MEGSLCSLCTRGCIYYEGHPYAAFPTYVTYVTLNRAYHLLRYLLPPSLPVHNFAELDHGP